jgi:tetratricopeptide (TPR) repeat protein
LTHYWLWYAYTESGKYPEALAELQERPEREPRVHLWERAYLEAKCGNKQKARELLRQILLLAKREYVAPTWVAYVYIALAEKDQAFAWLEKAYSQRHVDLTSLKAAPLWDAIRSDPRFADLVRRVGLPR